MKRKLIALVMGIALLAALLCGCGLGAKSAGNDASSFQITLVNNSGYIFHEMYVSATASNEWGDDLLGSTGILKDGGSYAITLEKYSYENYDIKIVDETQDVYEFTYVPLQDDTTVTIGYDGGPVVTVTGADGEENVITGKLNGEAVEDTQQADGEDQDNVSDAFSFTIYNESEYDIYAIYMAPANSDGAGVDILPEVLQAGQSYDYQGSFMGTEYEGITEWTLHVVDVDGDTSISEDVFIPWQISYVDIAWDDSIVGYTCTFVE